MIRFLIERPIAVTMALIAIVILGLLSIYFLPVSLMPEVDIPQITVRVNTSEMSARELENVIVEPLKNQLIRLNHLSEIKTETRDGYGNIFLEFTHGADINLIFIEVNEKIDALNYPSDINRPQAIKASATDLPAFYVNVSNQENTQQENVDFLDLSKFVLSVISKRIEQLPEVAMVDISGQVLSEVSIIPDPIKMEALGITVEHLENIVLTNNVKLGNLVIADGELQYNIRFSSVLNSKIDIENIYLRGGEQVYQLKEIASVREVPQHVSGTVYSDDQRAISMAVIKQGDARMADLQSSLTDLLEAFQQDYPTINFIVTRDQTALLGYSIQNLRNNLVAGIILASLLVFLFMRDLRSPLLITLTIPLALIISMLFLFILKISINLISLSGLVLAVGMMVDNSIVVIDNITQYRQRGIVFKEAVIKGAGDVFAPMLSAVLTTCAVFIPLIFLSGITGALFYDQAITVTIGLLSSLFVAVLIIPVYYYMLFRRQPDKMESSFLSRLQFINYEATYERGMVWVFRHQRSVICLLLALLLIGGGLFVVLDKSKLPPLTEEDLLLNIDWNQRVNIAENESRCKKLTDTLKPLIEHHTTMTGIQQFLLSHTKENTTSESIIYLKTTSLDNLNKVKERIAEYMSINYPKAVYSTEASSNIFDMIFSEDESQLVAKIRQRDNKFPEMRELQTLISQLKQKFPKLYIEPIASQEFIRLESKPEMMALYEIDYPTLFYSLRNALQDNRVINLYEGQFTIPVTIGSEKRKLEKILEHHMVVNTKGVRIPLIHLVREDHIQDLRKLTSGTEGGYYPIRFELESGEIPKLVEQLQKEIYKNGKFEVSFSGSYYSGKELLGELSMVLIVAVLLLYFILATQFESLIQPLIILFELITDISGALLLLWLCGSGLNLMSMIGIVVMCGIVINDSILKVDTINKLRKEGYSLLHAIFTAGVRRLKPILLTSLTTIFAIAPFLVRGNMGADLQFPLSVAIIGGMFIGTLVSIYGVPLLYYYIYRKKER